MKKRAYRTEKDYLGKVKVPKKAYYGIATERAIENFNVSELRLQKNFIMAYVIIKRAAAISNMKLGKFNKKKGKAIIKACNEILKGKFNEEFKVDVYQAGAGTSENMNINEVIANRALEILRKKRGDYKTINPYDHVNMSQSTNDTFHSAIHIAALQDIRHKLIPALNDLERELRRKGKQFDEIVKSGRTHLRDALPIRLGQEFNAYAETIRKNIKHIEDDSNDLKELNLGGTAIGTGVNASKEYSRIAIKEINKYIKLNFRQAKDLVEETSSLGTIARTSASLKTLAVDLIKIANDLRLLSSGPATGLNEIELPAVQSGSSIMPGKVNPVIAEMLDMVGFQVIGNDTTIMLAAESGQLELNVMMPVVAYNLLNSIEILSSSIEIFAEKCVKGIKANEKKCREYLDKNPIIVTALTPYIGYKKASEIAIKAYKEDRSVRDILEEKNIMGKKELDRVFNLRKLTITRRK